ncbi:acetoacetate metabolism regulatory protein AtoC [Desulfosarcina ovata subsp. ovata]|uniref:Acetoacetate metabolism regulatory protein AtoC n=1 Tax=Desulfosarcina ovata subsp. ovata TaxID=2752305 RepID=A0A5K8AJT8_9BACT|nr:acetoacetate metabolism regulatory protein AtoC [Desulfosarcina ovata subsp. ovata]
MVKLDLNRSILIVDDEESIRTYLAMDLEQDGYEVHKAENGRKGMGLLTKIHVDVVLLDLNLGDINGIEILREIQRLDIQVVPIVITAYGDIRSAVEAMKLSAFDYITKPFDADDIKIVIEKAFKFIGLENHINLLERQVDQFQYGELITCSSKMKDMLQLAEKVSATDSTILIHGETGTGKELVSSFIHRKSARNDKPFVTIDCTSLPENLMESELFGHEKGAFTGAINLKRGLFEVANEGTVFLNEIGELPSVLQSKILRVLESRTFRRIGSEKYLMTDVRVVAATNRNLGKMVEQGTFRSDLYYRLNVVPIEIPPLRERKEDIMPLVESFVAKLNKRVGKSISSVSNGAADLLLQYQWPGNIRELKNVVEHMVITCNGDHIGLNEISSEIKASATVECFNNFDFSCDEKCEIWPDFQTKKKEIIQNFEKSYALGLLKKNAYNISQCARDAQMHRSSFQRLMRKYDL